MSCVRGPASVSATGARSLGSISPFCGRGAFPPRLGWRAARGFGPAIKLPPMAHHTLPHVATMCTSVGSNGSRARDSGNGKCLSQEVAEKVSEFCRTLVAEYEDALQESQAAECARIRNSFLEQEMQLRAEVVSLRDANVRLSRKVKRLTAQTVAGVSRPVTPDATPRVASSPALSPSVKGLPSADSEKTSATKTGVNETKPKAPSASSPQELTLTAVVPEPAVRRSSMLPFVLPFTSSEARPATPSQPTNRPNFGWLVRNRPAGSVNSFLIEQDLADQLAGSEAAEVSSRYMLHPNSGISIAKDIISILCLVWDAVSLPCILAWDFPPNLGLNIVSLCITLFWTIEMVMCCNTGYYTMCRLQMRRSRVLQSYAKHWLFLDILTVGSDWANLIIDFTMLGNDGAAGLALIRLVKFNRLLRLLRAFRAMKLRERLRNIGVFSASFFRRSWGLLMKVCQYVLCIFWLNHLVACWWFAIGRHSATLSDTGLGWLDAHYLDLPGGERVDFRSVGVTFQYLTCLHYAISSTVLGSLSVNPTNSVERVFTVSCLVLGFVTASMLVSSLSSWFVQVQMLRQEKTKTLATLWRYMRQTSVSTGLSGRIEQHVRTRIDIKPRLREEQVDALDMLTPALRGELRHDIWGRCMLEVPLVRALEGLDKKILEDMCLLAVKPRYLEVGDDLFQPSTSAEYAFVLMFGSMTYSQCRRNSVARAVGTSRLEDLGTAFDEAHDGPHSSLATGSWIAEHALWVPWTYVGTATASSECEVLTVSPTAVEKVLTKRPHILQIMVHYRQTLAEKLSTVETVDLSDITPCVLHVDVLMGMHHRSRVLLGVPALRTLKQRLAYRLHGPPNTPGNHALDR